MISLNDAQLQYDTIIKAFANVEQEDNRFIQSIVQTSCNNQNEHLDLSTLFLVNRLFTQACRMIIFSIKDLKLTQEKAGHFDKAIEPGFEPRPAEIADSRKFE